MFRQLDDRFARLLPVLHYKDSKSAMFWQRAGHYLERVSQAVPVSAVSIQRAAIPRYRSRTNRALTAARSPLQEAATTNQTDAARPQAGAHVRASGVFCGFTASASFLAPETRVEQAPVLSSDAYCRIANREPVGAKLRPLGLLLTGDRSLRRNTRGAPRSVHLS